MYKIVIDFLIEEENKQDNNVDYKIRKKDRKVGKKRH